MAAAEIDCPRCRSRNRASARFCDSCGAPLAEQAAPELKPATVVFADVVASTEQVDGLSPEEVRALLAPSIRLMVAAVEAFGGTVNRVLGDAVMGLFGTPVALEDHALRACSAALRMRADIAAERPGLPLRVGIASGPILLDTSGRGADGVYPAFGATIHLASRLEGEAEPGSILCDEATRSLAGPGIDCTALGHRVLRGFREPVPLFAVAGAAGQQTRFRRIPGRELSPFVGRTAELARLAGWAERAAGGAACTVTLVGEAGIGKSRLAWEFSQALLAGGWQVIRAEAVSFARDVPYHFIAGLVRAGLGIDPHGAADEAARRLRARLGELGVAAGAGAALLSLLGLPLGAEAAAWDRLEPTDRRAALRRGVREVLDALCTGPTLLLVEDLQWADEQSIRLLDLPAGAAARRLLLVTQRPGFDPGWSRPPEAVIAPPPLSVAEMDRLLAVAFPGIDQPGPRRRLVERAAGNPFFAEEMARALLAGPVLAEGGSPAVPPTVQAVIAARIDRLAGPPKRLLTAAAALGNRPSFGTLRAIFADWPEAEFLVGLAALFEAEMLRPMPQSSEEVSFAHGLVQEVAYAALLQAERLALHRRIVAVIQGTEAGRLAEQAEQLVYHAAAGEVWEVLVEAAGIAGRRAASRSAYAEAARLLGQAIAACGKLAPTEAVLRAEIDLRFELRRCIGVNAGISGSLGNSRQAMRLARRLDDPVRRAWALGFVARDLQLVGRPSAAIRMAERAQAHGAGEGEIDLALRYYIAQARYARGEYAAAAAGLRTLIADATAAGARTWRVTLGPPAIFFGAWLTWSLARLGRTAEALEAARDLRRRAEASALPLCRMLADLSEGLALAHADRLEPAHAVLEAGLALCREWEFQAWSPNLLSALGHVEARLGRFDAAFARLGEAMEFTRASGILVSQANEQAWMAEALLLAGRPAEAARLAGEAVATARQHDEAGNAALALLARGEALLAAGEGEAGRAALREALGCAEACGMAPLVARCRAALAGLAPAAGAPQRSTAAV